MRTRSTALTLAGLLRIANAAAGDDDGLLLCYVALDKEDGEVRGGGQTSWTFVTNRYLTRHFGFQANCLLAHVPERRHP